MKTTLFLFFIVLLFGCKTTELQPVDSLFGVLINSMPYQDLRLADSLVSINILTKNCLKVAPAINFPGLEKISINARSNNKNLYIYKDTTALSNIGLIDLQSLKYNSITLNDKNIRFVVALHVDELENMLYAITISYDEYTKSDWLGLLPINLKTMRYSSIINFKEIDPLYIQNIKSSLLFLSEIDYKNKRIFVKSPISNELIIYNYKSKELLTRELKQTFFDLHYNSNNDCLFGSGTIPSGGTGLFEYSIINNNLMNIGSYQNVFLLGLKGFYFDKKEYSYWISVYRYQDIIGKLIKIDLSDASATDSMIINGPYQIHKRIEYIK